MLRVADPVWATCCFCLTQLACEVANAPEDTVAEVLVDIRERERIAGTAATVYVAMDTRPSSVVRQVSCISAGHGLEPLQHLHPHASWSLVTRSCRCLGWALVCVAGGECPGLDGLGGQGRTCDGRDCERVRHSYYAAAAPHRAHDQLLRSVDGQVAL